MPRMCSRVWTQGVVLISSSAVFYDTGLKTSEHRRLVV